MPSVPFDHLSREALDHELASFAELFGTAEMAEGTGAFLEKRPPQF